MPDNRRTAESKRTLPPRDSTKSDDFRKDWEKLSRSGKHDMHRLKEVMMLLIANDTPLPPEWKDHQLKGVGRDIRECHAKGDLLLVYRIKENDERSVITFLRAGTHSEIFGK
ncbi:MAG: type II toxin-antitoxin system YafQ family toxin [Synergistaceae bacterium]|nr:type II toxin-antitoxin system YafQ family toxin [Synergistaceae bacterium]MBQ7266912.1 type II toxin-antitoxin system YafQ family toxin [Synergistaceae bacterium]